MSEETDGDGPSLATCVLAAVLSASAGFGAVYVSWLAYGNGGAPDVVSAAPQATAELAAAAPGSGLPAGLSTGQMEKFVARKQPEPLPAFSFSDADGGEKSLADWKGKVVLLNLWATWCAPCKKEMPSLDRLNSALGGEKFEVVAVSVDKAGEAKAQKFLDDSGAKSLPLYIDQTGKLGQTLKAPGMPATFLIGPDGRELGRLIGPAEWDSPEAKALVEAAVAAAE